MKANVISTKNKFSNGLRERHKREKSEEKIDFHHQDSNQGPSLIASDALTTELRCSRSSQQRPLNTIFNNVF